MMTIEAKTVLKFRCRTIALRHCRHHPDWRDHYINFDRAPAFAVNPRGTLIHRTRFVYAILNGGKVSHYHASYLCSGGCNFRDDQAGDILFADPPRDKLLCSFCHGLAEGKRLKSSDELAGRHVHRGILVPTQVCCLHHKGKK